MCTSVYTRYSTTVSRYCREMLGGCATVQRAFQGSVNKALDILGSNVITSHRMCMIIWHLDCNELG